MKDRYLWVAILAALAAGGLYVLLLWLCLILPYAR